MSGVLTIADARLTLSQFNEILVHKFGELTLSVSL